MSSQAIELSESCVEDYPSQEGQPFEYRPVPVLAVVGMVLGLLSVVAFFGIFVGAIVAFLGMLLSTISLVMVAKSDGALGGRRLALVGLACSVLFLGGGMAYQRHLYLNEVPEGFERVSFAQEISKKDFQVIGGQKTVHPDVEKLVGKPIFLKGFMYPTGQQAGLGSFLLVKDSKACCFGGNPALTDMIGVVMQDEKTVDYFSGRVSVCGELTINTNFQGGENEPIYLMTGRIVSKSKTAF